MIDTYKAGSKMYAGWDNTADSIADMRRFAKYNNLGPDTIKFQHEGDMVFIEFVREFTGDITYRNGEK